MGRKKCRRGGEVGRKRGGGWEGGGVSRYM